MAKNTIWEALFFWESSHISLNTNAMDLKFLVQKFLEGILSFDSKIGAYQNLFVKMRQVDFHSPYGIWSGNIVNSG